MGTGRARRHRRALNRVLVDGPEWLLRRMRGRQHWPPYSLRRWVGSRGDFESDGRWSIDQLLLRNLLPEKARVLEVGCGCGRLALALARDPRVTELGLAYHGVDVDRPSIGWCDRNIAARNERFEFQHVDLRNRSYNPAGRLDPATYKFPFDDNAFDLVVAASLFTHLLPAAMERYLEESARLLTVSGTLWATFFLLDNPDAPPDRHAVSLPYRDGLVAVHSRDDPEKAIGFAEGHVLDLAASFGLTLAEPIAHGAQDHLFFTKQTLPAS